MNVDALQYASFKYNFSQNLGDQIQSMAAEQYLPRLDCRINRDTLRDLELDKPHVVIMNGWFSHSPKTCFPPRDLLLPVFWGLHLDLKQPHNQAYFLSSEVLAYFKRHEPIGCRDRATQSLLQAHGIQAFYSKCLTMTFPRRQHPPREPLIFLVDVDFLPGNMFKQKSERITQSVGDYYPDDLKMAMAECLLKLYRERAGLIVTSRLHCALPCIAMGIPVVFFGDAQDPRFSILQDIGQTIYPQDVTASDLIHINWNPKPLNIESEKHEMIARIRQMVQEVQHR